MNLQAALEALNVSPDLSTHDELRQAVKLITQLQDLTAADKDTLRAMFVSGPLFDGDLPSKTGRDHLIDLGWATKVVMHGQDGYNACTSLGAKAFRALTALWLY